MVECDKKNFDEEVLEYKDGYVFVDFFGDGCEPCMALMPHVHELADKYIKALSIATPDAEKKIGELSGGNQQKVILARWLLTHPEYLILDEPTRGIDVGTKLEIQKLVLKLAEDNVSVTFISSEIEEMLRVCSRLIVMRDRKIVGELTGDELTQATVMKTIAGGEQQ